MNIRLHKRARTTPAIRQEIRASTAPIRTLAREYGLNRATVRKWKARETPLDASHCPHTLHATLTPAQEILVVELRRTLLLPLDDLLVVTHEFINPDVSRSGLDRGLRRHGVSNLAALRREQMLEEGAEPKKTFKDYAPGFVRVDIKYLPQMPDEDQRRYLFVGIDRATRWVYLEILPDKSADHAAGFAHRLVEKAPFIVSKILTDNGKEFTDRFAPGGEREPTGKHEFDQVCAARHIEHRLIAPRPLRQAQGKPQTNGMVERFNGRISEVLATTRFDSAENLEQTLKRYERVYNQHIPQKALGHIAPIQALKNWQNTHPELFKKKVYNLAGLDN
jgi:transposase InsO family protein